MITVAFYVRDTGAEFSKTCLPIGREVGSIHDEI